MSSANLPDFHPIQNQSANIDWILLGETMVLPVLIYQKSLWDRSFLQTFGIVA